MFLFVASEGFVSKGLYERAATAVTVVFRVRNACCENRRKRRSTLASRHKIALQ